MHSKLDIPTPIVRDSSEQFQDIDPSVERAIKALEVIATDLPLNLQTYFFQPDAVLTLSGERAQSEIYISNLGRKLRKQLEGFSLSLMDQGVLIVPNTRYKRYGIDMVLNIISLPGLRKVNEECTLKGVETDFDFADDFSNISQWVQGSLEGIKAAGQVKGESEGFELAASMLTGVVKGYPSIAIKSFETLAVGIDGALQGKKDPRKLQKPTQVNIKHAHMDDYVCDPPFYSLSKKDQNHPTVAAHKRRWQEVLNGFYTSDFHEQHFASEDFRRYREIADANQVVGKYVSVADW